MQVKQMTCAITVACQRGAGTPGYMLLSGPEAWSQQDECRALHGTCQMWLRAEPSQEHTRERLDLWASVLCLSVSQMVKEGAEASTLQRILADIGPRASRDSYGEGIAGRGLGTILRRFTSKAVCS